MLPTEEFLTLCEKYENIFPLNGRGHPSSVNGHLTKYKNHKFLLLYSLETKDRGALGRSDIEAICHALDVAEEKNLPVIFYLDSSGAKLDEVGAIQASFRKLLYKGMRFTHLTRKLIFLMGKNVFGGASLFSMCGGARLYSPGSRVSMTGPRVLEKYNECNDEEIHAIISSEIRVKQDISSYWTINVRAIEESIEILLDQSAMQGRREREKILNNIIDSNKFSERVAIHDDKIICIGNRPPAAIDILSLAKIIKCWNGEKHIVINCEWESHSVLLDDEITYQSQTLFFLSNKIYEKSCDGFSVETRSFGDISGGLYIAIAAPSQVFSIKSGAKVHSLPSTIIDIIKSDSEREELEEDLVELGVIDKYLGASNEF